MFVAITVVTIAFCGDKTDEKNARISLLAIEAPIIG